VCIVLLQWELSAPPSTSKATDLIGHLMKVSAHPARAVLSANIDVIRLFLGEWKREVSVDKRIILGFLASDEQAMKTAGLQLFGVLIAVGIKIYDPFEDAPIPEKEVYHRLLDCLGFKTKEVRTRGTRIASCSSYRHLLSNKGSR
jgi:hypothetical protein